MGKYIITLTWKERLQQEALVSKGLRVAQEVVNALILLNCDGSIRRVKLSSSEALVEIFKIGVRKMERVKRFLLKRRLDQP
ncbi:MAG: hypothetical protein ACTXOO_04485 [Sodalis sp. (in: enterobacteria)]